ncbi:MAG TPA: RNA pseudouridine synthase [Alphaproteobacteria bacterium]|nr:RNA pseudouridine synthase [Alphaproteobacteria bacterium]
MERLTETDIASRLLYRDTLMLVLDKPAGIPVHAGPGGGPNLENYFDALRFGLPRPPALAHRLDRDTSGCLVLGRHRKALAKLGRLFAAGRIEKTYWAIVEGMPKDDAGRIDLPLRKRSLDKRSWRMETHAQGQPAVTDWRVLARGQDRTWLELSPRTGRTHQIRVHCASIGCPLVGDAIYGRARPGDALLLHARAIRVPLYPSREAIFVAAMPPKALSEAIEAIGGTVPEVSSPHATER